MSIENQNRIPKYHSEWKKYAKEYGRQYRRIGSDRELWGAFLRLRDRIRQLTSEDQLEPEIYCERVKVLHTFLDDLGYALNPGLHRLEEEERQSKEKVYLGTSIPVWYHRNIANMKWLMKNEYEKSMVNPIQIDKLVARYLSHRWLRDDWVDWVLLDAYIWYEVAGGWEQFLSSFPSGWPKWDWLISGRDLTKAYLIRKGFLLSGILIRYVIPISVLFFFWKQSNLEFFNLNVLSWSGPFLEWATRLYLLYLVIRLITWPFRLRARRNIKKEEDAIDRGIVRLQEIYMALADPPISLENLRTYVYKARDESVTLRSGTYSLLDELARRKKVVLAWED